MSTSLSRAGNNRVGTCPHGLPLGACPICNGMGGGGSVKRNDNKPREMTWNECYAVGQMMKAQKLAKENAHKEAVALMAHEMALAMAKNIAVMKSIIMNALPKPLSNALTAINTNIITPIIKFTRNFVNFVQTALTNTINFIKEKLVNIMDKLSAMFGEMKNALEKNISDKLKNLKKKIFNLFGIEDVENEEEEIRRIEEEKRLFEMKKTQDTILNLQDFEEDGDKE